MLSRTARGYGDTHPVSVDLVDALDRRSRRYQVGRLDLHVGRAEGDRLRALGLSADVADVPDIFHGGIRQLARGFERHELERNAQALGHRAGHVR
jgi:hypothetical protein